MRLVAAFLAVLLAEAAHSQPLRTVRLPAADVVGEAEDFGQFAAGAVGPDGSFYVTDRLNHAVFRYSAAGQLMWRAGRKGQGPGEFQIIGRVAPLPDGGALVYDQAVRTLVHFAPDGRFLAVRRLDRTFSHLDGIVALPDGSIAVAGIVEDDSAVAQNSIHIFRTNLRHLRSFGPLPVVKDPAVLRYWGAGSLTLSPHGDMVFTRRHPYEMLVYSQTGVLRQQTAIALPLKGTPDDAFSITLKNGVLTTKSRPGVTRLMPGFMLASGLLLAGRADGRERVLDLADRTGRLVSAPIALPAGMDGIIAYDALRNVAWGFGTRDDVPVILRIPFREFRP